MNYIDDQIVHYNRKKIFLYALFMIILSVFLIIMELFMNEDSFNYTVSISSIIPLFSILILITIGFYFFKLSFKKEPALTVNKVGIFDESSWTSVGFIPWSDIKKIEIVEFYKVNFIKVSLYNTKKYLNKKSFFQNIFLFLNNKFYGSPIFITPNFLLVNIDYLFEKMYYFHEKSK